MKSLTLLWSSLATEMAGGCCTSATRDIKTVSWRFKHEGQSFLTITLPSFGKDFEKSLDQGYLDKQDFQGFSWKSGLPTFLQGFLCLVFDPSTGRLKDQPNIDAIHAVRQLTLLYSKLFLLSNKKRERAAMDGYILCEQEIRDKQFVFASIERARFRRVANIVLGRVLRDLDILCRDPHNLIPSHGPGATADGLKGNRKYSHLSWTMRLEKVFPSVDFLLPSPSYYEELEDVDFLEPDAEIPVKVISVPKTQKTPRIIAMEPTAMQFAQQSLRRIIYDSVESDDLLKTLIGFTDQTPNQRLAREGSLKQELATLDLSEASDRVSCQHVEDLLSFTPSLSEAVFACRSTKADVPEHGIHSLFKFASMGSALSFPIEAMVFITLIFVGYEDMLNRPLRRKDVEILSSRVRVFGDDIIIPVDLVPHVTRVLHLFGMKVNEHKSFWTGRFRESCGKEYYDGHDISIVKVRQMPPSSLEHAQEIISWVSLSNQLYRAGWWQTVKMLDSWMSGILKDYPVVLETSPVLGRHSYMGFLSQKTGGRYQIPLVKGFSVRAVLPKDPLGEHYALLKFFLQRGELPNADKKHLERAGRPHAVSIKRGWSSAT